MKYSSSRQDREDEGGRDDNGDGTGRTHDAKLIRGRASEQAYGLAGYQQLTAPVCCAIADRGVGIQTAHRCWWCGCAVVAGAADSRTSEAL